MTKSNGFFKSADESPAVVMIHKIKTLLHEEKSSADDKWQKENQVTLACCCFSILCCIPLVYTLIKESCFFASDDEIAALCDLMNDLNLIANPQDGIKLDYKSECDAVITAINNALVSGASIQKNRRYLQRQMGSLATGAGIHLLTAGQPPYQPNVRYLSPH